MPDKIPSGSVPLLTERFSDAFDFASKLHRSHLRKSTQIPYLSHPMAVCSLVLEHGGDENEAIAALLHDVVEDEGPDYPGGVSALTNEIARRYGDEVLRTVLACSDREKNEERSWLERKMAYVKHLSNCGLQSVLLVSAADKLHNVQSLRMDYRTYGPLLWERFNQEAQSAGHQVWYYEAVGEALARHEPKPLVDALQQAVAELRKDVEAAGEIISPVPVIREIRGDGESFTVLIGG